MACVGDEVGGNSFGFAEGIFSRTPGGEQGGVGGVTAGRGRLSKDVLLFGVGEGGKSFLGEREVDGDEAVENGGAEFWAEFFEGGILDDVARVFFDEEREDLVVENFAFAVGESGRAKSKL